MVEHVNVPGLARLPAFSHATIAGDTVYVAGTIGTTDEAFSLASGGTGPETEQTLRNIEQILGACGVGWADVLKVNVFLTDLATFGEMNAAYEAVVPEPRPARITVGCSELALGSAVEIDCIAQRP